jgi:hypothetical protein
VEGQNPPFFVFLVLFEVVPDFGDFALARQKDENCALSSR